MVRHEQCSLNSDELTQPAWLPDSTTASGDERVSLNDCIILTRTRSKQISIQHSSCENPKAVEYLSGWVWIGSLFFPDDPSNSSLLAFT